MVKKDRIFVLVVFLLLMLAVSFSLFGDEEGSEDKSGKDSFCEEDRDCLPKQACHPTDCVLKGQENKREGIFCTQDCVPGTLDCGQGYCDCNRGICEAVIE
ncbi:hypothetical protein CMI45_01580 [Candidatus Pacearchaeota archaeon]|jgi:hypothetical protein|nr:hypothetical protein [Candidatus Pacearchaeota archaeon]|tara:strand:- start:10613 stop:10915 length:303 start_codon:yes stop_codon:yes gene_type:complete